MSWQISYLNWCILPPKNINGIDVEYRMYQTSPICSEWDPAVIPAWPGIFEWTTGVSDWHQSVYNGSTTWVLLLAQLWWSNRPWPTASQVTSSWGHPRNVEKMDWSLCNSLSSAVFSLPATHTAAAWCQGIAAHSHLHAYSWKRSRICIWACKLKKLHWWS